MRYLITLIMICSLGSSPALAGTDAQTHAAIERAAHSFSVWKLEAYRRRELAGHLSLANSVFEESILGHSSSSSFEQSGTAAAGGFWSSCPQGYRSGSFVISLELPAGMPAGLDLQLFNRNHELICSRKLSELHVGRTDIEISLADLTALPADPNPVEIILDLSSLTQDCSISSIHIQGQCRKLGLHEFAAFDLAGLQLSAGQRIILF